MSDASGDEDFPADPIGLTQQTRDHPTRQRLHAGRPYLLGTLHEATDEIRELSGTLGLRFLTEVFQNRDRPHAGTFFGKGKLTQIRSWIDELRAEIVPEDWMWDDALGHWVIRGGDLDRGGASDDLDLDDLFETESDESGRTSWAGTAWGAAAEDAARGNPPDSRGAAPEEGPGATRTGGREGLGRTDPLVSGGAPGEAPGSGDAEGTNDSLARRQQLPPHSDVAMDGKGVTPWIPDLQKQDLLLILNEDVRPAVLFNLEERLGVEVWDRTRLILEIFGQHAHVKEAKLQVELAMLQYEIPLIHEAVHRKRSGERAGFLGGGEYGVADYEDFIKRRMRTVKDELEHIRQEREVRRKVRRERFYLVSLAGYTNAGKSSILNALTGAGSLSEGTMFSTLETTTRRMADVPEINKLRRKAPTGSTKANMSESAGDDDETLETPESHIEAGRYEAQNQYTRPILLTDTVGFIQALPAWLLEAFHSTLEEIALSEVVLLVADLSDPIDVLEEKIRVCRQELAYLDVTCPVLLVLNKTDLLPEEAAVAKRARLIQQGLARQDLTILASSWNLEGIPDLIEQIHEALPPLVGYEARLPMKSEGHRLLSLLYDWGPVFEVNYGDTIDIRGRCDPIWWKTFQKEAQESGAVVSRISR